MKKLLFLIFPILFLFSCNNSTDNTAEQPDTAKVIIDSVKSVRTDSVKTVIVDTSKQIP